MDYKKHYDLLINSRQQLNRVKNKNAYYERHHIVPRCLGGTNDKENLVLLTAKEHFIAHLLLTKIFTTKNEKIKMYWAFWNMCLTAKTNGRFISASQYEHGKLLIKIKGRVLTDAVKKKISLSHIGLKHTEESKQKISIANTGIKWDEKAKEKISLLRKGLAKSQEHKNRIGAAMKVAKKGSKHSDETKRRMSEAHKLRAINKQSKS
jgi:hypothetical protein